MSDLVVARNCCIARMLPGVGKRFERSNGLDIALYKNYILTNCITRSVECRW